MDKPLAPEVRSQFALRLKEMRIQNGFLRARFFAKALGIEENRYTRYERAEVEPSLTLIQKMCETLRVSPNELLGFAETGGSPLAGLTESSAREDASSAEDARTRQSDLLAWRLASETVAVRKKQRLTGKEAADPLAATRETARLFQMLQNDPFGTVAEIAADDALKTLDSERKADFADIIEAYAEAIVKASPLAPHA